MRFHRIPCRPAAQGSAASLRVRHSATGLTDGAGHLLVRQLWDQFALSARIDHHAPPIGGHYRASTMCETWVTGLLYGVEHLDDLTFLASRGVAPLFGWPRVPDPTTMGRWLRRGGQAMADHLDALTWWLVRARWRQTGVPRAVTRVLDSTVVQRYGTQQAGATAGSNPTRKGHPSHHPLLAFLDTGDCLGVRWRPGAAHTAAGALEWIPTLVDRLRQAGVAQITVRLDRGCCAAAMVALLRRLRVDFALKVPDQAYVRRALGPWRASEKADGYWTATGTLLAAALRSVEHRETVAPAAEALPLPTQTRVHVAHVLTNRDDWHALTAWRTYNAGTLVEQRLKELYQLGFGATAIDDLGGNALLAALTTLAYQVLHVIRTTALTGTWRRAQPARLRRWLLTLPARVTTHARKRTVPCRRNEPLRHPLLAALRGLRELIPPRLKTLALP